MNTRCIMDIFTHNKHIQSGAADARRYMVGTIGSLIAISM
jgi:hypothetical protein